MPFVQEDLGWVRFHGRINGNDIAANGLSAITAVDAASTQERLFNPSKTAGAIVLHGSLLIFQLLLFVDSRFVNLGEMRHGPKQHYAESEASTGLRVLGRGRRKGLKSP